MTRPDQAYAGWQHERVNFMFGMNGRRTLVVALAVLSAVQPVAAARLSDGLVAWPAAAVLIALAYTRVAGRTVDEWMVASVSFQLLRLRGQNKFHSAAFAPAGPDPAAPGPLDLPGVLAPVRILSAETGTGAIMAVLYHPHERTYTAVARIRFQGLGLADSGRRDAQVSGWGRMLAGLCVEGHPIIRVQAMQRSRPEDGVALSNWHADHLAPGAPPEAAAVTTELLAGAVSASVSREEFLAFTMDERRAAQAIRAAGGGEAGASAVLVRHVRALAGAVSDAELEVDGWLTPRELAEVMRTAFDPASGPPLAGRRYAQESAAAAGRPHRGLAAGTDPSLAGPAAAEASWGSYRHDSGTSVSFMIYDWPRGEVYASALFPLLGDGASRRAVSLYLQPLSPREAERRVLAERTQRDVAIRMRQRTGQIVPEHEKAAQRRADDQDAERAAGHGLVRFSGYVSVTVTDDGDLADALAVLEADAAAARIEIRRMWGAQDVGFALAALPAGLGLPRRGWEDMPTLKSKRPSAEQDLPAETLATLVRSQISPGGLLPEADEQDLLAASEPASLPPGPVPPRRGLARRGAGRAPRPPVPRVFRGSTAQVQGLYPWLHGAPLPACGAYVGVDCLSGAAFSCHPVEWLHRGLVTNPNMLITGVPGAGKSATIKALALRLMAYGVRAFVVGDVKNEYAPLARALGVTPVELGPGLGSRLNPLDAGPLGENLPADPEQLRDRLGEIHRRRLTLLSALVTMRLGRPLDPTEEAALSLAIRHACGEADGATTLTDPTIPQVWQLLRDPVPEMARELRVRQHGVDELRELIRPLTDALGNMVTGSLSGLFDGPTTVAPDFDAPLQTVDLSRLDGRGDETVAMTLACVSSWGQAAIDADGGPVRLVIRDELWRSMRIPAMVRKIDSDLRLSRAHGTIQVLATHRLADFEAVGTAGSEEAAIARNLIASCDIRVCLAQDTAPLAMTREVIGLTDTECAHIGSWSAAQIGRALWKVGRASSNVVHVMLTPAEQRLFWTNEKMAV